MHYLAYLDPGTGSYLAAAIVGGFAGAMVAVRMWGRRVLSKLGLRRYVDKDAQVAADQDKAADRSKVAADQDS